LKDQKVTYRLAQLERLQVSKSVLALARRIGSPSAFAETLLVLWGELEYAVDLLVVREFGLDYDVKTAFLTKNSDFEGKIVFLRKIEAFDEDDMKKIRKFQTDRNELFHSRRGKEQLYFTLTKQEKEDRMFDAWTAYMTVLSATTLRYHTDQLPTDEPPEEGLAASEPEP
jgi:hypothetical protein